MKGSAIISEDGRYRYRLDRGRKDSGGNVCWIMLNPSTADAVKDDPTIRRCWGFTGKWGQSSLTVVNLFAYRATSPKDMKAATDPVGPENDKYILEAMRESIVAVAAWGQHGTFRGRAGEVRQMLMDEKISLYCLGRSKTGQPKHPLYIPYTVEPQELK